MIRKRRMVCSMLVLVLVLLLSGCKKETPPTPTPPEPTPAVKQGVTFLSSGFKIRTEIKPKNSVSADPLIFEVYVDSEGDGNGLVGYQDNVYDVYIVADQIYVVVSGDVTVHISDIIGHMVPASLDIAGSDNLNSLGFAVLEGKVVSYSGGTDTADMVSKYESSVSKFEPVAISQANNMTASDLIKYFFEQSSTVYVEPPAPTEEELERESYYVNSELGLDIRGVRYSIGDLCAPYTYFEESTPQGMNEKEQWNQDTKVIFKYYSYLSSDGSTMFMTTDGYVQAISTTSKFEFLGSIKRGMSKDTLEPMLGIGLKKAELESFRPLYAGMTVTKSKNGYYLYIGDLIVELEMNKNKQLASITLSNYLDFRR